MMSQGFKRGSKWRTKSPTNSANLGTDPPSKSKPSNFFVWPQALKNLASPPRQTKSPDDSNMLHMFNNSTYTDFKTVYKHFLIPSYIIWMI